MGGIKTELFLRSREQEGRKREDGAPDPDEEDRGRDDLF